MTRYILNMEKLKAINPDATAGQLVQYLAQTMEGDVKDHFSTKSPSDPGDPPGVDTGNLKNSIVAKPETPEQWAVLAGADYAAWLEYGTEAIAPRPFMLPAFERTIHAIPSDWLEENL